MVVNSPEDDNVSPDKMSVKSQKFNFDSDNISIASPAKSAKLKYSKFKRARTSGFKMKPKNGLNLQKNLKKTHEDSKPNAISRFGRLKRYSKRSSNRSSNSNLLDTP